MIMNPIEIIRTFGNSISNEVRWHKELYRFHRTFGYEIIPNGVLTKPGEEIHPLHRGLLTAGLPFSSIHKINKGENLPEEERRQVIEAAWLSISGTYSLNLPPEGGVNVAITIDNNEALTYLTANADKNTMVASLNYRNKRHFRYEESKSIGVTKDENGTWLTYAFPKVQEDPTVDTSLYICTRPLDNNKVNAKFSRLNLLLWKAPKQTDSI